MSALGQKRTFDDVRRMSALPPKADIGTQTRNVLCAKSRHSAVRRKALSAFARTTCGEGTDQTTMSGFGGEPSAFCESACLTEVSLAQESRVESRITLRGN